MSAKRKREFSPCRDCKYPPSRFGVGGVGRYSVGRCARQGFCAKEGRRGEHRARGSMAR